MIENQNFNPNGTSKFVPPNVTLVGDIKPKFEAGQRIPLADGRVLKVEAVNSEEIYAIRIDFPDGSAKDYKVTRAGIIQAQNNKDTNSQEWEFISDADIKES